MVKIAIGQLVAGVLLVVSGSMLWQLQQSFGVIDMGVGLWLAYTSIQNDTPNFGG